MQTREEAVEYLKRRGYEARIRDWSLGETIQVFADPGETRSERRIYRALLYIYRDGER